MFTRSCQAAFNGGLRMLLLFQQLSPAAARRDNASLGGDANDEYGDSAAGEVLTEMPGDSRHHTRAGPEFDLYSELTARYSRRSDGRLFS